MSKKKAGVMDTQIHIREGSQLFGGPGAGAFISEYFADDVNLVLVPKQHFP